MRKIRTQHEIDKEKKRNQIILGVGMVFLLIVSTLGYSFMNYSSGQTGELIGGEEITYNGYDFVKEGIFWRTNIDGKGFYFQFSPEEIGGVDYSNLMLGLEDYSGKTLYFVGGGSGVGEITGNVHGIIERWQEVCLDGFECENENLPIKTCEDNVIIFNEDSEGNRVYSEGNCVFIEGDRTLENADAFLYKILGVVE